MKRISVGQVLLAVKGTLVQGTADKTIERIVIDSREAVAGSLFFAIVGESKDGHEYGQMAAKNGALGVVVHRKDTAQALKDRYPTLCILLVSDTSLALGDLASWYLSLFPVKKIGVTGSTGKTTTKEMLYAIFSSKYKTLRNRGNFNNHIGLPLTVFELDEGYQVAIFEMGMSQLGEIHHLAEIVKPDLAVITNVGTSHIEFLGSRENIKRAKLEITDFMGPNQVLVVNSDNPFLTKACVDATVGEKKETEPGYLGTFQLYTAGEGEDTDIHLTNQRDLGEDGISFRLSGGGEMQDFSLPLLGSHNGHNAMLAVGAGLVFGIGMEEAKKALAGMENTGRRLQIEEVNGIKLIDDTYNASPDSMRAALDVLEGLKGMRKIAILADVLELGERAEEYHYEIGKYAGEKELDLLIAVGVYAAHLAKGAKSVDNQRAVLYYEKRESLLTELCGLLKPGDVVLVKGSNSMKMTEVAARIRSL